MGEGDDKILERLQRVILTNAFRTDQLFAMLDRDEFKMRLADGTEVRQPFADVVHDVQDDGPEALAERVDERSFMRFVRALNGLAALLLNNEKAKRMRDEILFSNGGEV